MGMSTHVIGFKPPDSKWKKMKAAREACVVAGVEIPDEIDSFFEYAEPYENGVEVELKCRGWEDGGMREGYEIHLSELPKDVTVIRFYNSW
jgi:hypothetical protein